MFVRYFKIERAVHLLTHLLPDYLTRKASPITTLQKLRAELDKSLVTIIKAVQYIPTRVTITVHNSKGIEALLANETEITAIFIDVQVKKEEHWITCIVPDLPSEYPAYDGETGVFTVEQAAAEFELQTKSLAIWIEQLVRQLLNWNLPKEPMNTIEYLNGSESSLYGTHFTSMVTVNSEGKSKWYDHSFAVFHMVNVDVMLGIEWLEQVNPHID
ncbi:hypothetical protein VTO42DRAFT_4461 [Malbranchea cinnamomea]